MGSGIMNIQVRVLAANARRTLRGVQSQLAAVQAQSQATSAVSPVGKRSFADMTKAGNQMQWVGRQLQYNFTLPLVVAGAAATKFALDQQAAMVHVSKVYGDSAAAVKSFSDDLDAGGETARKVRSDYENMMGKKLPADINSAKAAMAAYNQEIEKQELAALERNFDALSVRFATQKKEVMEVAGAWAAAGVSGADLARSVENTLIASNIGDMPAAKATEALISIQAQYNMSATKLKRTLADLNAIENATAVDMGGLIQSMAKSGSAAAASGTSARYLAAMTASITPAAGSASQAGNALKTILSRIAKPTEEGAAAMAKLGVNVDDVAWKSLGGAEKLKVLSKGFNGLSESEQLANASATVGIYQYNRYIQLLKDMGRENGNYNKALDATTSREKVFATMNKELNTILESNPKRLQRMGIALQNSLADIITPLIPHMIYFAGVVADLAKKFTELPPGIQKVAMGLAVLLVVMPLLLRYLGSLKTLFVVTRIGVGGLARALGILTTATQVQTVVDGESITVTEMKRKGLIGLFLTMLKAPFLWFGKAAGRGLGMASGAFMFLYSAGYAAVSWLVTGMLPMLARFIASTVGLWGAGGAATAAAAAAGEAATSSVVLKSWASRVASAASFMATLIGIQTEGAVTQTAIDAASYAERGSMMQAFNIYRVGLAQAYNAAMYGIEAGASAKTLALTSVTQVTGTAMVVRGQATEVAVTAAGSTAKVGIIGRLSAALVALYGTMGARLKAVWVATLAFLTNPARILAALGSVAAAVGAGATAIAGALLSPWGIAIAAVLGLLWVFRDQIAQVWENIVNYFQSSGDLGVLFGNMVSGVMSAFNALPQGVQNAMLAVVKVVRDAALAVYEWFSYINPFAHHSPSLVENVTGGMSAVVKQFATLSQIKSYTDKAYAEVNRFGKLTAGLQVRSQNVDIADDRKTLQKGGASAATLKSYDSLQVKLKNLTGTYNAMGVEIKRLENVDIEARREMDHAIFRNEFAQKKLRLEMLRMEEGGQSIDLVKEKLSGLDDEIKKIDDRYNQFADSIAGMEEIQKGLAAAGAGSDITGFYDNQIKSLKDQQGQLGTQKAALEAQKKPLEDSLAVLEKMNDEMEKLQRQGEILDLEKAMKFDEADESLTRMKQKYDLIGDTISDITSAINGAVQAQENLNRAADERKQARKAKKDADKAKKGAGVGDTAGANFPDVTGKGLGGRKDFSSQVPDIDKLTDETIASTADLFAQVNPFKSMGGWFKKTWSGTVEPMLKSAGDWVGNFFGTIFKGVKLPDSVTKTGDFLGNAFDPDKVQAGLDKVWAVVTAFFALFWPDIKRYFESAWNGLKSAFESIAPEIAKFGDLWPPIKDAIVGTFKFLAPILVVVGAALLLLAKIVMSTIGHTIGPVIAGLGKIIGGAIAILRGAVRIIAGIIKVIMGLLTLDPKMILTGLGDIAKGIWEILGGTLKAIVGLFQAAWGILSGVVKGIVGGIVGFFKWLWDVLVGHSIVPDIINGILYYFGLLGTLAQWVFDHVLAPIYNFFLSIWNDYIAPALGLWWSGITTIWSALTSAATWIWDNVLKPVFGKFKDVWDFIAGSLKNWWSGIQNALSAIKGLGGWIWENVLSPVWNRFSGFFTERVGPTLAGWWGGITSGLSKLKDMGTWVWENALSPVLQKFKDLFTNIKEWITNNTSKVVNPMIGMVNGVIAAINKMIDGLMMLNKLPGIDFKVGHIDPIKPLAEGGQIPNRRVGNGWVTNGARAIVGEGKSNHPEYVIPTDPTHRNRAMSLFTSLGKRLGALGGRENQPIDTRATANANGVPMYFAGGILDDIKKGAGKVKDVAKGIGSTVINIGGEAVDWAKSKAGEIASDIYNPVGALVDRMIGKLWSEFQPGARTAHAKVRDVVFGTDEYMEQVRKEMTGKWVKPIYSGYSLQGGVGSYSGHNGQDIGTPIGSAVHAVSGGTVTTSADLIGNQSGGYRSYGRYIKINHADGVQSLYAHNSARIAQEGQKVSAGDIIAKSGNTGHTNYPHLHLSIWKDGTLQQPVDFLKSKGVQLAKGAIVRARQGGVDATVGEGNRDEAVLPLPRGWRGDDPFGGGNTYIEFHNTTLEFPNVEDGGDAEDFVNNLISTVKE